MLSDYKIKQLGYIRALDTEEKPVTYCKIKNDGINKMLVKKITIINDKDFKTNIDYYGNIDSYDDLDKICKAFTEVQLDAANSNVKY